MPTKCSICIHPNRAAIDQALVSNVPLRTLEARHTGTKRSALDRHRKHIAPALTHAKQAAEVADATTVLSRIQNVTSRCERFLDRVEQSGESSDVAAAFRELHRYLELLAKISGELRTGNVNAVQVNIGSGVDVSRMTDQELEAELANLIGMTWAPKTHAVSLFDNETIPPLAGYETNNRHNEGQRKKAAQKGERDPGWNPWRDAAPQDSFRMLQALWNRLTTLELDVDAVGALGRFVIVQVGFDLGEDQHGRTDWPKVTLRAAPLGVANTPDKALPQVVEGECVG